jgi:hypothetical protein
LAITFAMRGSSSTRRILIYVERECAQRTKA